MFKLYTFDSSSSYIIIILLYIISSYISRQHLYICLQRHTRLRISRKRTAGQMHFLIYYDSPHLSLFLYGGTRTIKFGNFSVTRNWKKCYFFNWTVERYIRILLDITHYLCLVNQVRGYICKKILKIFCELCQLFFVFY